ncbi:hypothetical protein B0H65DRAFT_421111 [Neurospora tetraspora]|uniref:Uncharacterized protein n=1 Tax=Neurospora tetraspora TaxID=94610 RepID=A0AAE0MUZ5_9PEZI|nr:hypothetical protein B0H65DRAFT_421111 [Neurospora tetraspora]
MAANSFDAPGPLPSFLDDGQAIWNSAFPVLPRGPCNYTDPALPRCGCRRFWIKLNAAPDSAELCQCSHHACFHDDFPAPSQLPPTPSLAFAGLPSPYGQEKPNSGMSSQRTRELLTPMEEDHPSLAAPTVSSHLGVSRDFGLMNFHASGFNQRVMASQPLQIEPLQIQDQPHQSLEKQATIPDAAPVTGWGNGNHTQKTDVYGDTQPLSPGYFLMQSQAPSTTASSQMRYMAPFFGKGLNTLTRPSAPRNEASIPEKGAEDVEEQAQANAQDVRGPMDLMVPPEYRRDMTPRPGSAHNQSFLAVKDDVKQLSDVVNLQEQRIDRLENTSFSVIGHDECYDKHEHTDLRVTDLEYRVDELEKISNDNASVAGASVVSAASNSTVRSSQKVTLSQFQALQAQISELQATSLPTYNKPWDLEVVFLPFPLKGIWVDARKIFDRRQSMGPDEDWTQLPNTLSRATPDPHDPGFSEWPGQYPDSGWLLPKAFANGRMIDQRLRSRGFIKTVQVRGPDARDVQLAIHKAFGNVLEPSSHLIYHSGKAAPESPLNEFLGLRQDWVPLRKIHRDNRLRFLAPAEMATPALWGFTFLMSSVVMKAPKTIGTHRLYITQPEAYIQDYIMGNRALMPGWTWQRIRELSRVYPEKHDPEETCSDRDDTPEADALEECWTRSDVLDGLPITDAANLRNSPVQLSFERSDMASFHTASSFVKANGTRAESPRAVLRKERKASLTALSRSRSFSPSGPSTISPTGSRHKQPSFTRHAMKPYERPYDRRSSPLVPERSPFVPAEHYRTPPTNAFPTPTAPIKRRRRKDPTDLGYPRQTTPHHDRDRDRDRFMSRSPSLAPPNRGDRKSTPGWYATPHSEHPSSEFGFHRGSSRGPLLPSDGYAQDSDQEMTGLSSGSDDGNDEDDEMTDCPIDNEATPRRSKSVQIPRAIPESSSSSSESDFFDIDVDDLDRDDELDGAKTDGEGQGQGHGHGQKRPLKSQDIPRAGIETDNEDFGRFSQHSSLFHDSQEDLNIDFDEGTQEIGYDDDDGDGNQSDKSEAPSEYPSKNISAVLSPETTKLPSPLITSGSGSRSGRQSGSQQQQQQGHPQQYPYPRALTKSQNLVLEIQDLIRLGQPQPEPDLPPQPRSQAGSQVATQAESQELGETYVPRSSQATTIAATTTTAGAWDTGTATATAMTTTTMSKGKERETGVEGAETETQIWRGKTATTAAAAATEIGPSWVAWAETATGKWPGFEFRIHEDETRTE